MKHNVFRVVSRLILGLDITSTFLLCIRGVDGAEIDTEVVPPRGKLVISSTAICTESGLCLESGKRA